MDMYAVPGETLTGIANAIRSKTGSDEQMPISAMAAAIEGISGGGKILTGTIIGDGKQHGNSGVNPLKIDVPFEPLAIVIYLRNADRTFDVNHVLGMFCHLNIAAVSRIRPANSMNIVNANAWLALIGEQQSPTTRAEYNNGILDVYFAPASRAMVNGEPYDYIIWG